jgi:hypothetical protein
MEPGIETLEAKMRPKSNNRCPIDVRAGWSDKCVPDGPQLEPDVNHFLPAMIGVLNDFI